MVTIQIDSQISTLNENKWVSLHYPHNTKVIKHARIPLICLICNFKQVIVKLYYTQNSFSKTFEMLTLSSSKETKI